MLTNDMSERCEPKDYARLAMLALVCCIGIFAFFLFPFAKETYYFLKKRDYIEFVLSKFVNKEHVLLKNISFEKDDTVCGEFRWTIEKQHIPYRRFYTSGELYRYGRGNNKGTWAYADKEKLINIKTEHYYVHGELTPYFDEDFFNKACQKYLNNEVDKIIFSYSEFFESHIYAILTTCLLVIIVMVSISTLLAYSCYKTMSEKDRNNDSFAYTFSGMIWISLGFCAFMFFFPIIGYAELYIRHWSVFLIIGGIAAVPIGKLLWNYRNKL